jgi:hypothetical protein
MDIFVTLKPISTFEMLKLFVLGVLATLALSARAQVVEVGECRYSMKSFLKQSFFFRA